MENPTFYAIIPATVRYDKELTPNAKLLYGELTCLSNSKGYCFATNSYFAEVYGVAEETISRWISNLRDRQYIEIEYFYRGAEVKERRITMAEMQKDQPSVDEKINRTVDENVKGISTSVNTNNGVENSDEFPTHKPPFSKKEQKEIIGNMNKAHKRSLGDISHTEPLLAPAAPVSGKPKKSGKAGTISEEDLPMWNLILKTFRDGFAKNTGGDKILETGEFFGSCKTILKMKLSGEKFLKYYNYFFGRVGQHEKQYEYLGLSPRGFIANYNNIAAHFGGWTEEESRAASHGTATKEIWEKVKMK